MCEFSGFSSSSNLKNILKEMTSYSIIVLLQGTGTALNVRINKQVFMFIVTLVHSGITYSR